MSKMIFCNIASMKYYRGITEDDKPENGGKHVVETGMAYECYNFLPVNHFCYGYFQHVGRKLDLQRIDRVGKRADILRDIKVIWVANRKIIGLYDKAEVFRYLQTFSEPLFDENHADWEYWVKAREENVYLIPSEDRNFDIPSASRLGPGKGMGQAPVWYADTEWALEFFIPKVEEYLATVIEKYPNPYLTVRRINQKVQPSDLTGNELWAKADELINSGETLKALEIYNYLVFNSSLPYESCLARYNRGIALEKNLMYDEAIGSYKRTLYEYDQLDEENKSKVTHLNLDCYGKLARIYFVMREYSVAYSLWKKLFYQETEPSLKCDALYNMMCVCKTAEAWDKLSDLFTTYEDLKTDKYINEVTRLKKIYTIKTEALESVTEEET